MGKFIHIRSSKFPILSGEKEELVNNGMYGKALAGSRGASEMELEEISICRHIALGREAARGLDSGLTSR